jgi:hypothetical protein
MTGEPADRRARLISTIRKHAMKTIALAVLLAFAAVAPAIAGYSQCTTSCYGNTCTTSCY